MEWAYKQRMSDLGQWSRGALAGARPSLSLDSILHYYGGRFAMVRHGAREVGRGAPAFGLNYDRITE